MQLTILLATYNGEKYLREQLDSLMAQTYTQWLLLAHDDGSSDATIDILRSYNQKDQRIKILDDNVRGLGAAQNFLHLLKHATTDLIMFCDQDDIWMRNKLEVMVRHINSSGQPAMSYCNANIYRDGKILHEKLIMFHATDLRNTMFLNGGIHGCLQIINKPLRDILVDYTGYVCMHDHLITLAAVCFGDVKYVDESLMYYRQHSENVTVGYETNTRKKIKKFLTSQVGVIDHDHYQATVAFYEHFKTKLTSEQKAIFLAYMKFVIAPFSERINILFRHQFKIGRTTGILLFKTILRKPVGSKR